MIPKKPGAIECELHRTISLMSHAIKLIRRIIMTRIRRVIRTEISQTQCGPQLARCLKKILESGIDEASTFQVLEFISN